MHKLTLPEGPTDIEHLYYVTFIFTEACPARYGGGETRWKLYVDKEAAVKAAKKHLSRGGEAELWELDVYGAYELDPKLNWEIDI